MFLQDCLAIEESNTFSSNLRLDRKFGGNQFEVSDVVGTDIFLLALFSWGLLLIDQVLITVIDDIYHLLLVQNIIKI